MKKLKLRVYWCPKEKEYMVFYPSKSDGGWILNKLFGSSSTILPTDTGKALNLKQIAPCSHNQYLSIFEVQDFIKDLESRGYDKTTLKFEVQIDLNKILENFPHVLESLSDKEKEQLEKMKKAK